uniref:adhesion G protein-coupled receptor F5-like n=1 Tax=Pristiophorus japonicus TaxID=55135 RepID=UPI00398EA3D4
MANISEGQKATPGNLIATLDILTAFSSVTNVSLNQSVVEDFLGTVNSLVDASSTSAWRTVQTETKDNSSSKLLKSVESFTRLLSPTEETFKIIKPNIQLKGAKVDSTSSKPYNVNFSEIKIRNKSLSTNVTIAQRELVNLPNNSLVISIAYPTMIDILDTNDTSDFQLNGLVLTTTAENSSTSIEMNFMPLSATLDPASVQCVFWNFDRNSIGGWDGMGCKSEKIGSNIVCKCNHLTSFSILMSRFKQEKNKGLHYISMITISISMGSLVISVIIEAVVWKHVTKTKTSHARHIAMLNIVLSLLTANTWFIISDYLEPNTAICKVAVLFIHFLHLALFFWMFILALLLLYHLIFLFKDFSRSAMKLISFTLGYLCPLIISISTFTVGYTRNHYLRKDECWLNVAELSLYLTFVGPPLTIVTINIFITLVAIFKMLRPTIGEKSSSHSKDKNAAKQIMRSIAILTPLLGLTWVLGFAYLNKKPSVAVDYIFNILNGLQGLFIFIFGIIMDSKVQEALTQKFSLSPASSQKSSLLTASTSSSN